MDKKSLLIVVAVLVAVLTVIVFLQAWNIKNNFDNSVNMGTAPAAQEPVAVEEPSSGSAVIGEEGTSVSSEEIDSLEKDMDSINDDDLGEGSISDKELEL